MSSGFLLQALRTFASDGKYRRFVGVSIGNIPKLLPMDANALIKQLLTSYKIILKHARAGSAQRVVAALLGVPALIALARTILRLLHKQQVDIYAHPSDKRAAFLLKHTPSLRAYSPPAWMDGNVQTLWGLQFRPRPPRIILYRREMLALGDGGEVALDWHSEPVRGGAVCILFHGLTGGSQENYVQHMVYAASEAGMCVVVMNSRGCADSKMKTPRGYSACWTADVRATVRRVRELVGSDSPIFAAGFSFGATVLSRYLVEEGNECDLQGAAVLCATLDRKACTLMVESGLSRFTYCHFITESLRDFVRRHEGMLVKAGIDLELVYKCSTVRVMERATIVPQFGFEDEWHYYEHSTTGHLLQDHVAIPTLVAHARDDPICSVQGVPVHAPRVNPNLVVALTDDGGHVAWLQGSVWPVGASWIDACVVEFFQAVAAWNAEHGVSRDARRRGVPRTRFTDTIHCMATDLCECDGCHEPET